MKSLDSQFAPVPGWVGWKWYNLFLRDKESIQQLADGDALERLVSNDILTLFQGEFSAGVRKSEKVSLRDPIMPIDDGFGG